MMRLVLQNLPLKLLALAISVLLWVVFVDRPELVTSVSAPVEYQNTPDNLELSSSLPERVYLEVQGPSARLHSLDLSQASVVLNLGSVRQPGEHTFTIERRNIDMPAGLRLVRVVPSQVRLQFERRMQADVPVRLHVMGPPPAGYHVGRHEVQPRMLQIIGPESHVKQVAFAETDPIDLSGIVGQAEFPIQTFISDRQVRLLSSPVVHVKIWLEKN
jgi:YbbR domain-containing protein